MFDSSDPKIKTKENDPSNTVTSPTMKDLADYFSDTHMTYSYKPLLMLALLEHHGSATVSEISKYFRRFYLYRREEGRSVEKGCVFAEYGAPLESLNQVIIRYPIPALMKSGYFVYDKTNKVFSLVPELKAELEKRGSADVEKVCRGRLIHYFTNLG